MNDTNQGACQSRKTAKNAGDCRGVVEFPSQELVANPNPRLGTFATPGASKRQLIREGVCVMLGKLAGAWLGEKIAGRNSGAKGAILGYGAAALARRSVPTLAALALGGWAYRRWKDHRRSSPDYPSEASPS
jgi:hypothetical protein